jgi:hypothetical protein
MHFWGTLTLLLFTLHGSHGKVQRVASTECDDENLIEDSIYNYTLQDLWGIQNVSLSDYRGKVRDQVMDFCLSKDIPSFEYYTPAFFVPISCTRKLPVL